MKAAALLNDNEIAPLHRQSAHYIEFQWTISD